MVTCFLTHGVVGYRACDVSVFTPMVELLQVVDFQYGGFDLDLWP